MSSFSFFLFCLHFKFKGKVGCSIELYFLGLNFVPAREFLLTAQCSSLRSSLDDIGQSQNLAGFNVLSSSSLETEFPSNFGACFIREHGPGILRLPNHTDAGHLFRFCLQAGPPQRVNCFAPMGNLRKASFPRTQRCIASLGIEPGVSNISTRNPTLY